MLVCPLRDSLVLVNPMYLKAKMQTFFGMWAVYCTSSEVCVWWGTNSFRIRFANIQTQYLCKLLIVFHISIFFFFTDLAHWAKEECKMYNSMTPKNHKSGCQWLYYRQSNTKDTHTELAHWFKLEATFSSPLATSDFQWKVCVNKRKCACQAYVFETLAFTLSAKHATIICALQTKPGCTLTNQELWFCSDLWMVSFFN